MDRTNKLFIQILLIVYLTPVALAIFCISLPTVAGQTTPNQTPTTTIQGNNLPSSIEFIPQKAIITTLPPAGENIPQNNEGDSDGQAGIAGTIMAAVTGAFAVYTKISSKRDHDANKERAKGNAEQIVTLSDAQLSQNKTMFELAPEDKVKAMEGTAPEIKIAKLQENKEKAVANATKA